MTLNILSFALATVKFFVVDDPKAAKGKNAVSITGAMAATVCVYKVLTSDPSVFMAILSTAFLLLSLGLFLWTIRISKSNRVNFAFSEKIPEMVLYTGPYGIVRHPFYVSYTLTWIAAVIAAPNIYTGFACLMMFGLYFASANSEERTLINSQNRLSYLKYRQHTGKFLPKATLIFFFNRIRENKSMDTSVPKDKKVAS